LRDECTVTHWESSLRWNDLLDVVGHVAPFVVAEPLPAHDAVVDRAQIELVLINLVKSAREAGSEGAGPLVRIVRRSGGSALVVEDRGRGMDDETLTHALLPFYSTKPGGTGLGLALVGEIIDAHGGNVRIARRDVGEVAITCWIPDE
jgi:Signal transduction histidine kinase